MIFKNLILDPFQEKAINHIEKGNSVLVSAPTGTGKTLIADYVVEHHIFKAGRIIYTAPIKALSNQKYREYSEAFGYNNIGLLTGDFKINTNASFTIMTTEILRNILYSDDMEYINSIVSVIFDEIHYIGDEERGVAWEEAIIKLSPSVQIIGLSATIPNIREFAEWISFIKGKRVYFVKETKRHVPLKYYLFARGFDLREINSQEDINHFVTMFHSRIAGKNISLLKSSNVATHFDVIKSLGPDYFPMLYFNFNRKQCEEFARFLAERFDFNLKNKDKKLLISKEIDDIKEAYSDIFVKELNDLKSILEKGIGFHHSGMNPVYKRLVEVLVEKGLIKVLYCTSTFALGLNFPVKTVVFGSISKFNGIATLPLTSQQFHQKAGRAGRRGIDHVGHVVITSKLRDFIPEILYRYISNKTERIKSAFDLSYNSVINLLYINPADTIESILLKSFWAFQEKPEIRMQYKLLEEKRENLKNMTEYNCTYDENLHTKRLENDKWKLKNLEKQIRNSNRRIRMLEKNLEETTYITRNQKQLNKIRLHLKNLEKKRDNIILNGDDYSCRDCLYYQKCAFSKKGIFRLKDQINHIEKAVKKKESYLSKEFWFKVDVLKKLDYLRDDNSFNFGAFVLKEIQINELLLTELVLEGVFERLDYNNINALCASLSSRSSKKSVFEYYIESLTPFMKMVDSIVNKLLKADAISSKKEVEFDFGLSGYAYMWSSGISWHDMMNYLSSYENPISVSGDLVYAFRRGIDILRQVLSVYRDNKEMYDKIKESIDRMDRDIISMVL